MKNNLIGRLAFRYLSGKGSANAVPVLSRISMVAIAVSSCAMIILFSVFNGFEALIDDLYKAFYPDIKISASRGKFFDPGPVVAPVLKNYAPVAARTSVLEDNVLINTDEGETIPVVLKGVDKQYFAVNDVKSYINDGADTLFQSAEVTTALVGQHIAATLGIDVKNVFSRIMVYYPNGAATAPGLSPEDAFLSVSLKPDGTFMVQEEFDSKYLLTPLPAAEELMHQVGRVSSVELKIKPGYRVDQVKRELQNRLGKAYAVATRYEQNKAVYMVMQSERWAGYAILLFVLLIASFNMISALSLLVLEKQKDMGILRTMGILPADLGKVILLEGVLWAFTGGGIGLLLGLLLCLAQQHFALVKIQGAFIIESYPVSLRLTDVFVVLLTVCSVGFLAAVYPARRAARQQLNEIMGGK